jgi:hypothetical protein
MQPPIANYVEPREKLRELATPDCKFRVIFLEGGAHYGKTFLLERLKSEASVKVILTPLDKRRAVPTPLQLLSEIATFVGWKHFPKYDQAMDSNKRPVQANISHVSVQGSYVNVEAVAQESEDDRLLTAIRVTGEFFEDLRTLPEDLRPLILAFDGYDANMSLIDRWFDSILVQGLCDIDHVRLIVGGRSVPLASVKQRIPGGRFVEVPLNGVVDVREWMQIVLTLNCRLPDEDEKSRVGYLRGVVAAFRGAPGLIVAHLKSL